MVKAQHIPVAGHHHHNLEMHVRQSVTMASTPMSEQLKGLLAIIATVQSGKRVARCSEEPRTINIYNLVFVCALQLCICSRIDGLLLSTFKS